MDSVLIVDPDRAAGEGWARSVRRAVGLQMAPVDVKIYVDFKSARAQVKTRPPAFLVTALQLREYNGIHLVYLACEAPAPVRSLVYTGSEDAFHAREIRKAGAFYEIRSRLAVALPPYVASTLPAHDRRTGIRFDRREVARGGRRAADRAHTAA